MTWPQYLRRECSYKGWLTPLTKQEASILAVLLIRGPNPSSTAILANALYGDDPAGGPLCADDCVKQAIFRLRAKLPGAIVGRHGMGWCLDPLCAAPARMRLAA